MTTMLAGRLNLDTTTFRLENVEVPEPGPGEVRIKVAAAGICLSDIHLIDGTITKNDVALAGTYQPVVTLGHEIAGTIDTLGPAVPDSWTPGQRVLLTSGKRCGACPACRYDAGPCITPLARGVQYDGGWAEYTVTHHQGMIPVPDDVPLEHAAIVPDAVSTPYAGLLDTGGLRPGEAVGLWGVGGLGFHAVQIARLVGAAPVIALDPLAPARDRALRAGADHALDPTHPDTPAALYDITQGRGLDLAVDLVGHPDARAQALDALGAGGRLSVIGISPAPLTITDTLKFSFLTQQLRGHYGSDPAHLLALVELVRWGRLNLTDSISAILPLTQADEGVRQLASKDGDPIRIILAP
jgi:threonine dehydrogenase-like Zn-dependent dehydrogenase